MPSIQARAKKLNFMKSQFHHEATPVAYGSQRVNWLHTCTPVFSLEHLVRVCLASGQNTMHAYMAVFVMPSLPLPFLQASAAFLPATTQPRRLPYHAPHQLPHLPSCPRSHGATGSLRKAQRVWYQARRHEVGENGRWIRRC